MRDIRNLEVDFWRAIKVPETLNLWQWMERNFVPVGSARSAEWRVSITPWLREPAEWVDDGITTRLTTMLPVQSGKSALGEGALCKWIATEWGGDIQYNWEDDEKGKQRWKKRVRPILRACQPVMQLWPRDRRGEENGLVIFPHLNFTMQGVHVTSNLESDSIKKQVNEEIHGWEPGRMELANKRLSAYRDSPGMFQLNVSTGGVLGDQLHALWLSSTRQLWEEPCQRCGGYQHFHIKTTTGTQGGLYYDTEAARAPDGSIDYDILEETIYYECALCGGKMIDDKNERRARAEAGRYSDPVEGSKIEERGVRMEQLSIYWIPWVDIVREKHLALAAMKHGDIEPFKLYIQRVEAGFWDPEARPIVREVKLTEGVQKIEPSLPADDVLRFITADYQHGSVREGESEHFWAVIRDWKARSDGRIESRLVWEGRVWSREELEGLRESYGIRKSLGALDVSANQTDLLRMIADGADPDVISDVESVALHGDARDAGLYRNCWLALKGEGGGEKWYRHPDSQVRRRYSTINKMDPYLGTANAHMGLVPQVLYSEQLSHDLLNFCRTSPHVDWIDPEDVSDDYRKHMDGYERRAKKLPTGEIVYEWHRVRKRQDLYVCNIYQCLMAEFAGLVGTQKS